LISLSNWGDSLEDNWLSGTQFGFVPTTGKLTQ
jgi:hypothetical protein